MKKYYVLWSNGEPVGCGKGCGFNTEEEALNAVREYEEEDRRNECYSEDEYSVVYGTLNDRGVSVEIDEEVTYKYTFYEKESGKVLLNGEIKGNRYQNRKTIRDLARLEALAKGIKVDNNTGMDFRSYGVMGKDTVDKIMEDFGISQNKLSERFNIPYRTIQGWRAYGKTHRDCPEYILAMMRELLNNDKKNGAPATVKTRVKKQLGLPY